jgi:LacI family transcriptional regulator
MIGLYMMGEDLPSSNWTLPSNWLFYNPILKGISSYLSEAGYRLRLELITARQAVNEGVLSHAIKEGSLDGILLVVQHDIDYGFLDVVEETGFPMVILNGGFRRDISSVKVDNGLGARQVVDYLVEKGHTKIAHIAGPSGDLNALERKSGFIDAIRLAGLKIEENPIKVGDWQIESGRKLASQLMEEDDEITAIFCANDHMAVGALQALRCSGISVPNEVSVLGFDDTEICEIVIPRLSSVKQSLDKVGRISAKGLVAQIKERKPSISHVKLDPELVIRDSTSFCPK